MIRGTRSRKQKLIAEINITPFTDVILVLLIIFMITTPLISQSNIKVNLPQVAKAETAEVKKQIFITITDEGLIYLDNEMLTIKELKEKVSLLQKNNPGMSAVLRSDKLVRFKDIVNVLDILNYYGIKNLNIAVTTEH